MNLPKLFEMQKKLDDHIIEKKGLQGQDLLPNTILSLYAELGELLNEWRGFKYWKENNKPRRKAYFLKNDIDELYEVDEETFFSVYSESDLEDEEFVLVKGFDYDIRFPLLEEYVDCLHFILSIGLQLGLKNRVIPKSDRLQSDLSMQFNEVFYWNGQLFQSVMQDLKKEDYEYDFGILFMQFIRLGEMLGFTWEQIEKAYYEKNNVNHVRQSNGY